jgi:hypothetical protein
MTAFTRTAVLAACLSGDSASTTTLRFTVSLTRVKGGGH